ncbi:MAG: AAA family ATPase [Candidatus Paceibacterota bacterium]
MYLKSIKIKNFRKIKEADCFLNPGLNLIIGPNDSGKTAIIDAIRLILKQIVDDYFRISEEDFNDKNQEINIDLNFSFDDCETDEESIKQAALFAEYLSFTDMNKPELMIWFSIRSNEDDIKFPSFKVGPTKDVAVEMDARCKENLKIVYLRPLRDAENELKAKTGSRISKILNKYPDVIDNKQELIGFLKNFKDVSENFFDNGNGKKIKEKINELLKDFDEQSQNKEIKIGPTELSTDPKMENQNLIHFLEKNSLYYEKLPKPGLGTLNMIFIAAELLHLDIQPVPRLLLVEEIEAHLHPQRQLKIIKTLQEESKKGVQMILTTHSPNLASVVDVDRLNICCEGKFHSLAKGKTELSDNNYAYLARFLDVTKANLFFGQGIILVEGPTEQLLIPELAKIIGHDLTNYGISVISTNNLGFDNFINIFKRREIPYNQIPIAVLTDSDRRNSKSIEEYILKIKDDNNSVNCFVGPQLYSDKELTENKKRKTTFEKIIFNNTAELKNIYIESFNSLKKRKVEANTGMDFKTLYKKMHGEKAKVAQCVAQTISNIPIKDSLKIEIETNLEYIVNAITFVIPKKEKAVEKMSPIVQKQ